MVSLRSHCLPEARERIEASGASYRGLGLSRWNPLALRRIREALLERPVDVVHTHLEFSDSLGVIATHSLGRDRPRVINHVHNYPAQQYAFITGSPAGRWRCTPTPTWSRARASAGRCGRASGTACAGSK